MKRFLLATLAALTLASGAGYAADLPQPVYRPPPPPPPPAPVYNWTGCYLGAGGGYGMWNDDYWGSGTTSLVTAATTSTAGGRGWFGRASVGCDYQFSFNPGFADLNIVAGVFADGDLTDLDTRTALNLSSITAPEKEGGQWAVGGRVGLLVTPRFLPYTTFGFTEAHFDQLNFSTVTGAGFASVASKNYDGYFLGTGFEYAFAFLPGFFLRTEYRFSSFDTAHLALVPVPGGPAPAGIVFNSTKYVETFGTSLVYRFNWN